MGSKKWLLSSLTIIFVTLFLNILFLYTTDTYSIANPKTKVYYTIPNQRFLVVEYLLNYKHNYDTLIFGSSRVGAINPLNMKDKHAYNTTYGEGVPHEHLIIIKLLIKNKIPIKHILIGLDDFSYQVPFARHQNQLMPKSHYLATGDSIINYYKFYFLRQPDKLDILQFKHKFLQSDKNTKTLNGIYATIFKQEKRYSNIKYKDNNNSKYINSPRFLMPTRYSGNEVDTTIKDIEEIIKITKENNIELVLFINPIHHTTYKYTDQKQFQEFRDKLSYITDYYDFSYPNFINNNNLYWKETSHYGYRVGDMILDRIYNNITVKDFGSFISKKNKKVKPL